MSDRATLASKRRSAGAALAAAAVALCAPGMASAAALPFYPSVSLAAASQTCSLSTPAQPGAAAAPAIPVQASKSSAILGGHVSALDSIRAQQTSLVSAPPLSLASMPQQAPRLEPSAGWLGASTGGCSNLATIQPLPAPALFATPAVATPATSTGGNSPLVPALFTTPVSPPAASLAPPLTSAPAAPGSGFLDSRRIAIERTLFDAEWARVKAEKPRMGRQLRQLLRATGEDRAGQLATVNRWVNHNVTFVDDRVLFGKADYWAGANTTLKLGKGDCEDFALLKMQLLAAAGVPRTDMIITIARDLVRRADHAVLIVRTGAGDGASYVMLDNATDEVLDASAANDYRPVLSFGANAKWLHGY